MSEPRITAIVSTFKAERFMRGCLEDLVAQTLLDEMEILVIDSGSPQGEGAITKEFAARYPQIRYLRTENEPLYVAWNRAIGLARGTYLTNANTDDRHSPDFMATMVDALDRHPEAALAYAQQLVSHTENETFAQCKLRGAAATRSPDFDLFNLMIACLPGTQAVWRKALHEECGVFDTGYQICADYDMWFRFAVKHPLLRVHGNYGVAYMSENTLSGAANRLVCNDETLDIQCKYLRQSPWRDIPGLRKRMAAEFFGRGYQNIRHERNSRSALPFFREAIALDPTNFRFIKTYAVRRLVSLFSLATGQPL